MRAKKIPLKKNNESGPRKINQFNTVYVKLFFAAVILLLYGRSIGYEFVLDDELFIKNNPVVQKGIAGIGETFKHGSLEHFIFRGSNFQVYRPLMISAFCIERAFFGFTPAGYHFISILLYFLLSVTLFNLLRKLFANFDPVYSLIIALLFIVHPVHSEVVANVKSQDELLSSLFSLLALSFSINAIRNNAGKIKEMVIAIIFFLLALFSKESAAFFIVVFPLSFLLLMRLSVKRTVIYTLPFFMAVLFFLLVRFEAVKSLFFNTNESVTLLENVLYGAKGIGEHTATRLSILFEYLKLMIVPYPLSWDYSYNQVPLINWDNAIPYISLLLYLLLAGIIIRFLKKRPEISFGFIVFLALLSPLANVFFINGANMAVRFLFMPSVGFISASVFGLLLLTRTNTTHLSDDVKKRVYIISGAVVIIFSILSFNRCDDWKNNFAVFESGVLNSPNSSRTNDAMAKEYMNESEKENDPMKRKDLMEKAVNYFTKSLSIYPDNYEASYKVGLIYNQLGENEQAIVSYSQCLQSKPDYVFALNNLGALYNEKQKLDSALYFFSRSYLVDSSDKMILANLAIVQLQKGENDEVIHYCLRAINLNYGDQKIYNLLAIAYANKGDMTSSQRYIELKNKLESVN